MDAGEGLADVEGVAVAVVVTVVFFGEGGGEGVFAGEEAGGEGEADDEGDAFLGGEVEKFVDGLLAEDVEDDLEAGEVVLLEAGAGFVHGFDADAEVADEAFGLEFAEPIENVAPLEDGRRDAVELVEVDGAAESIDRGLGVVAEEGFGVLVGEAMEAAEFGGNEELVGASGGEGFEEAADEGFGVAAAVDVGGVDEGYAVVEGGLEDLEGGLVGDGAPIGGAELPAAQADFGDGGLEAGGGAGVHEGAFRE